MKDYTEQQKQMMLQFRTASQKSTLLNLRGRAAVANPAPKPIPAQVNQSQLLFKHLKKCQVRVQKGK